jgi:glycosyltransferase involved in cell wall biosynthesis
VPCKNEEGNIPALVSRIPDLGKATEIIFVDDKSDDRTKEFVEKEIEMHPEKDIKLVEGPGKGKGAACRAGFETATGDVLMILDADMTVMPEDLGFFLDVIASGRGEFINGSRLVYPLESGAMKIFNILGNRFFSYIFTFLLSQFVRDTLCGTKVIWRRDYYKVLETRKALRDIDKWGDYDWLFMAARYNLRIVELPVHYRARVEGETKMTKRISNGLIMLRVCIRAFFSIKLI